MLRATRHEAPAASLVGGRYRLGEMLGEGAAGVVWRAHDERLDREVAVKQLAIPPGLAGAEVERGHADAAREGRIAARLDHPGVVAMLDMVVDAGCSWLVMEYVAGPSVASAIESGPLTPVEAARIGAAVADALAAAHAVGVVHSDVKPTNVLLDADATVKLADFGIACAVRDGGVTGPDQVSGTPLFMAPEVARGRRPDAAADVFSLAATVYAMVEGRAPFGSTDEGALDMMHRVARGVPNPTRRAGPLTEVLAALFVLDPARRPTATAARDLLAAIAGSPPAVAAAPASPRVIVPLTIRPPRAATPRSSRMVPLTVLSASTVVVATPDESDVLERVAVPNLTLLQGGIAPAVSPSGQLPARHDARWSRRSLIPLSAAGVVALGAIAGTLGAGSGLPLIQSASDLLNKVVGTGDGAAPLAGSGSGATVATEPSESAHGLTAGVPVAAPPIVPRSERSLTDSTSDSSSDGDRVQTVSSPSTGASSSSSSGSDRGLPVDAGVLEDVPLSLPIDHGLLSGGDDGGPVSGLTDTVSGVTGGLSGGLSGVTGGLSGGLSGVTGGLSGVTGGLTDGLSGVTGGLTGTVSGVTGGLTGTVSGVTGGLTDGVSGVTGGLTHGVSGVTGGLTGTVSGLTGGLTHGLTGSTHDAGSGRHGHGSSSSAAGAVRHGSVLGTLPVAGAQHSVAEPVTSTVTGLLGSVTSGGSSSSRTTADSSKAASSTTDSSHDGEGHGDDTGRHRSSLLSFGGASSGRDDTDSSSGRHARSSDSSSDDSSGHRGGLLSALAG